ncbi:MAG: hypothetical protein ACE5R6_19730 [Candidatus Heimdallarchaeota archaeon]
MKAIQKRITAERRAIFTDGLASSHPAIHLVFLHAQHQRYVRFQDHLSNDVIE